MFIIATGMLSPVGLTAASACAAKRAGISAFEDLPVEYRGEPIVGTVVPGIEPGVRPDRRLAELLILLSLHNLSSFFNCGKRLRER